MASNDTDSKNLLTKKGYDKLMAELEKRRTKIRTEIANKLELATEQGDLSENAAYKSALEEKELNEQRIEALEQQLANAQVAEDTASHLAGLGDKIAIKQIETNKEFSYTLVGQAEADPAKGMISIESPIGKAFYEKSAGTDVEVSLASGIVKYRLVKIN